MQALASAMGYVPKDRDAEAMMIEDSVRENFCMPSLGELTGALGCVPPAAMKKLAEEMVERLSVKCTDIFQPVSALSGGNKQKINLGRWLAKDLRVLILDCPTRGVVMKDGRITRTIDRGGAFTEQAIIEVMI